MSKPSPERASLEVIGADANNLKDIDCSFPVPGLSAIVGVSGSGKSSLLGSTMAAELSRRNALFHGLPGSDGHSPPVRAFLNAAPAALLVGQRPFRASSRTTVATATGLMADIRHLFQATGRAFTPEGDEIPPPGPESYAVWLRRHYRGRAVVWVIPLRWQTSDGTNAARVLRENGISAGILRSETDSAKLHETGRAVDLTRWKSLNPRVRHSLEAEVGRVEIGPETPESELSALIGRAWAIAGCDVIVELKDAAGDLARTRFGHQLDGRRDWVHSRWPLTFRAPDAHLLSFNAPEHEDSGACPRCRGLGRITDVDESALVNHPERSLREGAISLWSPSAYKHVNIHHETLEALRGRCDFQPDVPWQRLPDAARSLILDGTGGEEIQGIDPKTGRKAGAPRTFEGFRAAVLRRWSGSAAAKGRLDHLVHEGPCPDCGGSRWSAPARALRAAGIPLADWHAMPMRTLAETCRSLENGSEALPAAARRALRRLVRRTDTLARLGLAHLSGDRGMLTASDGEARRLQIGAVLAVPSDRLMLLLDEPARGLHETDLDPMIEVLRELAARHGVLINEHRQPVVAAADHVVELGPGPGQAGGTVLRQGAPDRAAPPATATPRPAEPTGWLEIDGATVHTVRDQNVRIPLGAITAIVGVSGSGKSSFMRGVLVPALLAEGTGAGADLDADDRVVGRWTTVRGADTLARIHVLHQRVPPRNRRSLLATMTRALDPVAAAYAATAEAAAAGLSAEDFRLNGGNGRCPDCQGTGESRLREDGVPCASCGGRRYGTAALGAVVAGLDVAQTLDRPVSALLDHWRATGEEALADRLGPLFSAMADLGIGHLALGRRIDSLSGGEVQRLRVALSLADGERAERHLFILDEPAAGLHRDDTERLVAVLRRMADGGRNTVVLIEHNVDLVSAVDWLVEFGPGAGPEGGVVIANGPPGVVRDLGTPTAKALQRRLSMPPKGNRRAPVDAMESDAPTGEWLGRLMTGELGEEPADSRTGERDVLARLMAAPRRVWEIADLDLEIAKLLLDVNRDEAANARHALLEAWKGAPEAVLAVNPLLPEMQVWGSALPRSALEAAQDRVRRLGLERASGAGKGAWQANPGGVRVELPRNGGDDAGRGAALDHALAVGGGYVELTAGDGAVLARLAQRPCDLERGLVGPGRVEPAHLSRLHAEGACPACAGQGMVSATDPALLLSGAVGTPLDVEAALTPPAAALFKGIWRTEVRSFLKRLSDEGLARAGAWREWLLFGFWARPGHGSFLKSPKADPDEVGSWLSWDGLHRRVWAELPRSRDAKWRTAVEAARREVPCPVCGGTGHGMAGRLLGPAGRPLASWIETATIGELAGALKETPLGRPRQTRTRDRILHCLEPLVDADPDRRIAAAADRADPACRSVAARAVAAFAMMEVAP